jgi:Zn-dependent protease with chaperone function
MANPLGMSGSALLEPPSGFQSPVVEQPEAGSPPKIKLTRAVESYFSGSFEPTEVSLGYRIGLVVACLGMALLLAVYLGIIVLTAYAVYYHLAYDSGVVELSANYVTLFAYFWPLAAGAVLAFFMVKPIFAGQPEQPPRYSLTAQSDPDLFALISHICKLVRAPLPSRVDVDCQINASASFRRGLLSMRGNDVVLTIGLPLAAGLSMQEFAGVLAHEFGHFAQGAGMKLTYIIRAISGWFARVVYERDEWDVRLVRAAHGIDVRIGIFLHLIRFAIWVTRRILWVLMHLGHLISCFMLRQMEYDADSYETKLSGSAAFARTSEKFQKLSAANQVASRKLDESWKGRRLPQNLPSFISVCMKNIPAEMRAKMEEAIAKKKTRILDTHPCDADRMRAANALNQPGVFHSNAPASELFADFNGLCLAATRFHYEHNLELRITDNNLVPHEITEKDSQSQADGDQALHDFFCGLKLKFRPILISETAEKEIFPTEAAATVKQARQAMESSKAEVRKALFEYEQTETLYQRGLDAVRQETQQASAKALQTLEKLAPVLEPFEGHAQTRLAGALQLLSQAAIAEKIEDGPELQAEADRLGTVFARLGQVFGPLQEMRRKFTAFNAAMEAAAREERRNARVEQAEARVNSLLPQLQQLVQDIREPLRDIPYPFHHAREDITLEEFSRNDIPASNKVKALCNDCHCDLDRLIPLYYRVLGRLCFIALQVEKQI